MSRPRRGLLAIWLALQLLLAQQFALAHHVEHLAEKLTVPAGLASSVVHDGDEGGSAVHVLSHVCSTCLACLGLGAALPGHPPVTHAMPAALAQAIIAVLPAPTFHSPLAFNSRAPPKLQD